MMMETSVPGADREPDARLVVERRRSELRSALTSTEVALLRQPGPDPASWLAEVRRNLDTLRVAFAQHVDVHEGADSFHEDVLRHQPALASRVMWLQRDHRRLDVDLTELSERVNAPATSESVVRVRTRGLDLVHRFARHRKKGADLVWDAFSYDLGGEQ